MKVASAETFRNLFVHSKYIRTHYIRTKHLPNNVINAIVVPRNENECNTQRNCSQLFQPRLQRHIGSCEGDEFRDS